MKQENIALKSLAMKAKLANFIRRELNNTLLEAIPYDRYNQKVLTDKDKIELLDKIWKANQEMRYELSSYKSKRQRKARIQKAREERKKLKIQENEK